MTISDKIGGDSTYRFPRPYQGAIWERRGVCVPGFHPADTHFDAVQASQRTWTGPDPLSAEGRYCAAVRGVMTTGDPGIDDPVAVDTLPETVSQDYLYTVPTELTPFSYRIVLDLSIPVADRCPEAVQTIQDTVATMLRKYTEVRTLPVIDLSAGPDPETGGPGMPCRQSPVRSLDAAAVAQEVKLAASELDRAAPALLPALLQQPARRAARHDDDVARTTSSRPSSRRRRRTTSFQRSGASARPR